ncbi:MAG TPA: polysaccharide deacetylase family protein [Streptosporangiaceae bacterium]|jgi:peptidoglycan/xylan/chitin deacetylase (PgdA/CDA1 family)|nr:polysaccharide deacetylase family protein [Streptosporangiaceae bacterium]
MSDRKPRAPKAVISRRVLLAAGGLVVLGEFVAGEGSGGATSTTGTSAGGRNPAGSGSSAKGQASRTPGATPSATPSDISSSSAAKTPPSTATPEASPRTTGSAKAPPQPTYYLNDGPKTIALTIDDGPNATYTPQILKLLQKYRVKATFSMIGTSVVADPGLAREVADAGHKVINHTWTHANLSGLTPSQLTVQIDKANDEIEAAIRQRLDMFRAPYGAWSTAVLERCQQMKLTPLDWSVDPQDWARPGTNKIISNIMKNTRTGSIILEHDGGGNRSQTVAALTVVIPELLAAGYRFRTA